MEQKQTVAVWVLSSESPLALRIAQLREKAAKHGKGEHSVEYWCEDLLARGAEVFDRYIDADRERRNRASYCDAVSKLTPPADMGDSKAVTAYAASVASLQRKYGIGGTRVQV